MLIHAYVAVFPSLPYTYSRVSLSHPVRDLLISVSQLRQALPNLGAGLQRARDLLVTILVQHPT